MTNKIHFTTQAEAYVRNEKVFIEAFVFPLSILNRGDSLWQPMCLVDLAHHALVENQRPAQLPGQG